MVEYLVQFGLLAVLIWPLAEMQLAIHEQRRGEDVRSERDMDDTYTLIYQVKDTQSKSVMLM